MTTRRRPLLAMLAVLAFALAACGDGAPGDAGPDDGAQTPDGDGLGLAEPGALRVGSDLNFPPFEFVEEGEERGFDIDLMDEVARRLGLETSYVDAPFETIFTQLAAGEFDAIISAITITDERDETIDFTDPYFAANQALLVAADSEVGGVADLVGRDVGAQAGTTGLAYAEENFTESTIRQFPTYTAAFTALEAGQLDAVIADLPVAHEQAQGSDALEIVEEIDTDELYGIGVQQGNEALVEAINAQLADIIDDGTYEEIYGRWFEGAPPEQFRAEGGD